MKKVCIISTHAPYGSPSVKDGIDTLLVAASYGMDASLLAMGEGVLQLLKHQTPDTLPQKNTGAMLQALEIYGIESVYVCHEDLEERGLTEDDLLLSPQLIQRNQIPQLLKEQDRILNF
ncbi:sulfurtransferase complex subunit TusC [Parendozoicomonas sp. Alg238-R29]|uniref:sulfurtransferase complex subunit TusC n=1 Tax=Parendozoicomonas sp. Alg238-R29 TaxID=2993446 RepID=UPI00248E0AE3|nr:sulfurtransferase complex subunit TusC [Parendozoicomonas sp. Alg238-R29]